MSAYQPAPPAPVEPPLVNGRPMTRTSWWPDRRPLPRRHETLVALLAAAAFVLGPWVVRAAGAGIPVELAVLWTAFGTGLLLQAVLDVVRPDPGDRLGVVLYRGTYVAAPLLCCLAAMLLRPL
ncbi:hypothetical protein [Angustibacter speluncae]